MRNKKGFSMMEAVIALSVILVVSFTAFSISLSSLSARTAAVRQAKDQNVASNVLECFKASQSKVEFENNLAFAFPPEQSEQIEGGKTGNSWYYFIEHFVVIITPSAEKQTTRIEITDNEAEEPQAALNISYEVVGAWTE